MTPLTFDRHLRRGEARLVAELARAWATADGYDVASVDHQFPAADRLADDLAAADAIVVARHGDRIHGYGRIISWTETSGTRVHLLDTHSAPGRDRTVVDDGLLAALEARARLDNHRPAAFGANAEIDDPERVRVLTERGFTLRFEVVELELRQRLRSGPLPTGITIRPARSEDAQALVHLTEVNWAGRPHFGGLSLAKTQSWLESSDPELFLLAEADGDLVGLAVGDLHEHSAEVDDLGVRPDWRRRGLATGLMTELLNRIEARSSLPIRLLTEADDPSGARTLYERLGFGTAARHGRFRKPLD